MFLRKEKFGLLGFDAENQEPFVIAQKDVPSDIKEYCEVIECSNKSKAFLSAPLSLYVYPSMRCNKTCDFCYFKEQINSDALVMDMNIAHRIVQMCTDYGVFSVIILGGEPFLNKTSVVSLFLINELCSSNVSVSITTNGITLSNLISDLLKTQSLYEDYLHINVSLNTDLKSDNTFHSVIASLEKANYEGLKVAVNTVVLSNKIQDYEPIIRIVNSFENISGWNLLYPRVSGTANKDISTYLKISSLLKSEITENKVNIEAPFAHKYNASRIDSYPFTKFHYGCGMGKRTLSIAPDGNVYGCSKLINNEKFLVGNVEQDLNVIWEKSYAIRLNNDLKLIPEKCASECSYYDICESCLADRLEKVEARCEYSQCYEGV